MRLQPNTYRPAHPFLSSMAVGEKLSLKADWGLSSRALPRRLFFEATAASSWKKAPLRSRLPEYGIRSSGVSCRRVRLDICCRVLPLLPEAPSGLSNRMKCYPTIDQRRLIIIWQSRHRITEQHRLNPPSGAGTLFERATFYCSAVGLFSVDCVTCKQALQQVFIFALVGSLVSV